MSECHFVTIDIHTHVKEKVGIYVCAQFFRTQTRKTNETHHEFPRDEGSHPQNAGRPTVPMPFILAAHIYHKASVNKTYMYHGVSRVFFSCFFKKVKVTHMKGGNLPTYGGVRRIYVMWSLVRNLHTYPPTPKGTQDRQKPRGCPNLCELLQKVDLRGNVASHSFSQDKVASVAFHWSSRTVQSTCTLFANVSTTSSLLPDLTQRKIGGSTTHGHLTSIAVANKRACLAAFVCGRFSFWLCTSYIPFLFCLCEGLDYSCPLFCASYVNERVGRLCGLMTVT